MNVKLITFTIVLVFLASSFGAIIASSDSDAAETITVTDGRGVTVTFDSAVDNVITVGVGVTATAIELGVLDKIVVCDKYSATNSNELFDKLKTYVSEGKVAATGSIYSSGVEDLKKEIIDATDNGKFDKESDALIITGSPSYLDNGLIDYFIEKGYTKILVWYDTKIMSYNAIIDVVEAISKVTLGNVSPLVNQMKYVEETIESTLKVNGITSDDDKVESFFVTYSSGTYRVGNITSSSGSLSTAMILAAGGNVITLDDSKASTYETNITTLINEHGTDVVVFVDNTIASYEDRYDNLRTMVGGSDVKLVPLDPIYNNYSVESMDCVWLMAHSMYPDLFEGEDPPGTPEKDDNLLTYAAIGIIAVIVIIAVAFFFMRGSSKA